MAGQHDLPQHSTALYGKSCLHVLEEAGRVKVLQEGESTLIGASTAVYGLPFGSSLDPQSIGRVKISRRVALCHFMTYRRRPPFPGCEAPPAADVIRRFHNFDLVAVGDNHESFTVSMDGTTVVNAGSTMQMTAAQLIHRPKAWLWYEDDNSIEPFDLPDNAISISREHLEASAEKDRRLEAFVRRLEDGIEIGLSFEDNLSELMDKSKTKKEVREIVWGVVERGLHNE